MPKRTALLVCNSPRRQSGRRKKTRPRRTQRMALHCFKPNFPYKYNSTARQNCQVRLKIHKSVTFPSYPGKEPVFAGLQSGQKRFQIQPIPHPPARPKLSKYYLRYFVKFHAISGIFSAVFSAFFGYPGEVVHLCKYHLPFVSELLACATIHNSQIPWAYCTILTPYFLHLYKITKSDFFGKKNRKIPRFFRITGTLYPCYSMFAFLYHHLFFCRISSHISPLICTFTPRPPLLVL